MKTLYSILIALAVLAGIIYMGRDKLSFSKNEVVDPEELLTSATWILESEHIYSLSGGASPGQVAQYSRDEKKQSLWFREDGSIKIGATGFTGKWQWQDDSGEKVRVHHGQNYQDFTLDAENESLSSYQEIEQGQWRVRTFRLPSYKFWDK